MFVSRDIVVLGAEEFWDFLCQQSDFFIIAFVCWLLLHLVIDKEWPYCCMREKRETIIEREVNDDEELF